MAGRINGSRNVFTAAFFATLVGCGGATDPAERRWQNAQSAFASEEYERAIDHLGALAEVDGWEERAAAWRVVLLGGLAHAYLELNEACEEGLEESGGAARAVKRNLSNALEQYRSKARTNALALVEATRELEEATAELESMTLDFPPPSGDSARSPVLARISGGLLPSGATLHASERHTLRRGVLLQSARVVGAGDNVEAAQKMFEFSPVSVPRSVFLLGLGQTLHEAAALFNVRRLRDHTKQELFFDLAEQCARPSLESKNLGLLKEAEDIIASIEESRLAMEDREALSAP